MKFCNFRSEILINDFPYHVSFIQWFILLRGDRSISCTSATNVIPVTSRPSVKDTLKHSGAAKSDEHQPLRWHGSFWHAQRQSNYNVSIGQPGNLLLAFNATDYLFAEVDLEKRTQETWPQQSRRTSPKTCALFTRARQDSRIRRPSWRIHVTVGCFHTCTTGRNWTASQWPVLRPEEEKLCCYTSEARMRKFEHVRQNFVLTKRRKRERFVHVFISGSPAFLRKSGSTWSNFSSGWM